MVEGQGVAVVYCSVSLYKIINFIVKFCLTEHSELVSTVATVRRNSELGRGVLLTSWACPAPGPGSAVGLVATQWGAGELTKIL